MRLSKANVQKISVPPNRSEIIIFDDDVRGFGVRLRAGGKRTWVAQYRIGSKQRRVTLGNVETIDADQARKEAKAVLAKVQLGSDPQIEKMLVRERAAETLGVLIEKYLGTYAERNLKVRTLEEVKRGLNVHFKPLHEAPAGTLSRSAVASRLAEIAKDAGPFAANRARAYLSAMFTWAIEQGLVDDTPVRGTGRVVEEKSRDRVLSDRELRLIYRHAGHGDYGAIIRLLMLTGQRREEAGAMAWPEIVPDRALWSIPADRTKNSLPHDVPLSAAAAEILRAVGRREGRELVFGSGEGGFSGWSKAKAALDARITAELRKEDPKAKPLPEWRLHDLRRSAATGMADLGVQPHVIEAILNHVSGHRAGVAGVYNRAIYAAEKRAALDLWGEHVRKLGMEGAM